MGMTPIAWNRETQLGLDRQWLASMYSNRRLLIIKLQLFELPTKCQHSVVDVNSSRAGWNGRGNLTDLNNQHPFGQQNYSVDGITEAIEAALSPKRCARYNRP